MIFSCNHTKWPECNKCANASPIQEWTRSTCDFIVLLAWVSRYLSKLIYCLNDLRSKFIIIYLIFTEWTTPKIADRKSESLRLYNSNEPVDAGPTVIIHFKQTNIEEQQQKDAGGQLEEPGAGDRAPERQKGWAAGDRDPRGSDKDWKIQNNPGKDAGNRPFQLFPRCKSAFCSVEKQCVGRRCTTCIIWSNQYAFLWLDIIFRD